MPRVEGCTVCGKKVPVIDWLNQQRMCSTCAHDDVARDVELAKNEISDDIGVVRRPAELTEGEKGMLKAFAKVSTHSHQEIEKAYLELDRSLDSLRLAVHMAARTNTSLRETTAEFWRARRT